MWKTVSLVSGIRYEKWKIIIILNKNIDRLCFYHLVRPYLAISHWISFSGRIRLKCKPNCLNPHLHILYISLILTSILIKFVIGHTWRHLSLILLRLYISLQFGGITLNFLPWMEGYKQHDCLSYNTVRIRHFNIHSGQK